MVAARDKFQEVIDLKIVVFPLLCLAENPESVDLVWQAMVAGAEIVEGILQEEKEINRTAHQIEIAFEFAKGHDADIDIHDAKTDDPYWLFPRTACRKNH